MYEQYLMRFYAEALAEGFQTHKTFFDSSSHLQFPVNDSKVSNKGIIPEEKLVPKMQLRDTINQKVLFIIS